jgi:hypothetical protein
VGGSSCSVNNLEALMDSPRDVTRQQFGRRDHSEDQASPPKQSNYPVSTAGPALFKRPG